MYNLKKVTILSKTLIQGNQVKSYWKTPMTMITTNDGVYIDFDYNYDKYIENTTIMITTNEIRGSEINALWSAIGSTNVTYGV